MSGFAVDAARIRAEAARLAGIADSEAGIFDANLDALVQSVNAENDSSEAGARQIEAELIDSLRHRLLSLKWVTERPEITAEPIEQPVFLTGLPRSGTTYFQYLFGNDPDLRLVRTWEGMAPCPPPGLDPLSITARYDTAKAHCDLMRAQIQGFDAIHLRDPDGPEECHMFLAQTFAAIGYQNTLNVPSYVDFLLSKLDLTASYRVHRRQLQILQHGAPARRWVLKYPNHIIAMPEIVTVYPDARFVITHRDPVQTLASICRLTESFRAPRMQRVNREEIGAQMLDFIARHLDRLMAFARSREGAKRIVNVDYYRLVAAPVEELARAYESLGLVMSQTARQRIADWRAGNPPGKRGAFTYALEEFGLDADAVAERFKPYREHFGVPSEADGRRAAA